MLFLAMPKAYQSASIKHNGMVFGSTPWMSAIWRGSFNQLVEGQPSQPPPGSQEPALAQPGTRGSEAAREVERPWDAVTKGSRGLSDGLVAPTYHLAALRRTVAARAPRRDKRLGRFPTPNAPLPLAGPASPRLPVPVLPSGHPQSAFPAWGNGHRAFGRTVLGFEAERFFSPFAIILSNSNASRYSENIVRAFCTSMNSGSPFLFTASEIIASNPSQASTAPMFILRFDWLAAFVSPDFSCASHFRFESMYLLSPLDMLRTFSSFQKSSIALH